MTNDKTREAFEAWAFLHMRAGQTNGLRRKESGEYFWSSASLCWDVWQAVTAKADAKYLPVIEKLVEALAGEQRLREIIRNADPRVEDYHAYQPTDNETHNALALAAPLLEKREEV